VFLRFAGEVYPAKKGVYSKEFAALFLKLDEQGIPLAVAFGDGVAQGGGGGSITAFEQVFPRGCLQLGTDVIQKENGQSPADPCGLETLGIIVPPLAIFKLFRSVAVEFNPVQFRHFRADEF